MEKQVRAREILLDVIKEVDAAVRLADRYNALMIFMLIDPDKLLIFPQDKVITDVSKVAMIVCEDIDELLCGVFEKYSHLLNRDANPDNLKSLVEEFKDNILTKMPKDVITSICNNIDRNIENTDVYAYKFTDLEFDVLKSYHRMKLQ